MLTTTVTSLEMRKVPDRAIVVPDTAEQLELSQIFKIPLDDYRRLYEAVGSDHHWTSRLLPDDRLADEIHAPSTRIYLLTRGDQAAGWFELDVQHHLKQARIVHLGILHAFRGKRLSGYLLDHAIRAAFGEGIERLTIETNTLDHPAALSLYQRHGFHVFARRTVETPAIERRPTTLHAVSRS